MQVLAKKLFFIGLIAISLLALDSFCLSSYASHDHHRQSFRQRLIKFFFGSLRMLSVYADTKNHIRLVGIPDDVAKVQIYVRKDGDSSSHIIGKRTKEPVREASAPYVDFKIEIGDSSTETIYFKTFEMLDSEAKTYRVLDTYSVPIMIIDCSKQEAAPVCASPTTVRCNFDKQHHRSVSHSLRTLENPECEEVELNPHTYRNVCDMEKHEARFLHDGEC